MEIKQKKDFNLINIIKFETYGLIKTITLWIFILTIILVAISITGVVIVIIEKNFSLIFLKKLFLMIFIEFFYITFPLLIGSLLFIYFFLIKKIPPP
jgi:hypothetical protein